MRRSDRASIVSGDLCGIIIEEELQPVPKKVAQVIDRIVPCRYLRVDSMQFELRAPSLFVVINGNDHNVPTRVRRNVGHFRWVIVCEQEEFAQLYESYYLSEQ